MKKIQILISIFIISMNSFAIKGKTNNEVLENVKNAIVQIEVLNPQSRVSSLATGFFISHDGLLITAAHSLENYRKSLKKHTISVKTNDGQELSEIKEIKCYDKYELDLCLLRVLNYKTNYFFDFKKTIDIGKGNTVHVIGHMNGKKYLHRSGALKDRVNSIKDHYKTSVFLKKDYPALIFSPREMNTNYGDSGAPVFYIDGISRKKAILMGIVNGAHNTQKWSQDKNTGKGEWKRVNLYKSAIDSKALIKFVKDSLDDPLNLSYRVRATDHSESKNEVMSESSLCKEDPYNIVCDAAVKQFIKSK